MMEVQLYTSLTGLNNHLNGKVMYAFTEESAMRNEIDDIVILVDFDEIKEITEDGIIAIRPKGSGTTE